MCAVNVTAGRLHFTDIDLSAGAFGVARQQSWPGTREKNQRGWNVVLEGHRFWMFFLCVPWPRRQLVLQNKQLSVSQKITSQLTLSGKNEGELFLGKPYVSFAYVITIDTTGWDLSLRFFFFFCVIVFWSQFDACAMGELKIRCEYISVFIWVIQERGSWEKSHVACEPIQLDKKNVLLCSGRINTGHFLESIWLLKDGFCIYKNLIFVE